MHDLGHPGGNSDNLVDMGDIRALVFNAKSVLENMHAMNAFLLFMNPTMNFLSHLVRLRTRAWVRVRVRVRVRYTCRQRNRRDTV